MAGSLRNTITNEQFDWLEENINIWYNVANTTITKYSTWSYLLIMQLIPNSNIASVIQLNNDGTAQGGGQRDLTGGGYWLNVFNGDETTNMYYYYLNHGANLVDSYDTLGLPDVPNYDNSETEPSKTKIKQLVSFNIFEAITDLYKIWDSNNNALNALYKGNRSGNKYISPLVEPYIEYDANNKPYISSDNQRILAQICLAFYKDNWVREWQTITTTYNLLEDYYKLEEHSEADTVTETPTDWTTTDLRELEDNSEDTEGNSYTYAFNSSNAVPVSKEDTTTTTKAKSERTQSGTYERETQYGHKIETTGKLGNKSYPELLKEDLEYQKINFYDLLFRDIDEVLTLSIYE